MRPTHVRSALIYWQLMQGVPEVALRREYRRRIARFLRTRRDPVVLFVYLLEVCHPLSRAHDGAKYERARAPHREYVLIVRSNGAIMLCEKALDARF